MQRKTQTDYTLNYLTALTIQLQSKVQALTTEVKRGRKLSPRERQSLKRALLKSKAAQASVRRSMQGSASSSRTAGDYRRRLAAHEAALELAGVPTEQDSPYIASAAERSQYRRVHDHNPSVKPAEQVSREIRAARAVYRDRGVIAATSTRAWVEAERAREAGEAAAAAQHRRLKLGRT